mgnify:CR=1 FL=1
MNIKANPNATNSEMDSKIIKPFIQLTPEQRNELIEQFVEIQLDNMTTQDLYELASEYVTNSFDGLTDMEIKERIESLHDEELYDELIDNVTTDDDVKEVEQCIIDTNGDYAECIDHLVEGMKDG